MAEDVRKPITVPEVKHISPDYKPPGLKRPQAAKGEVPISPEPEEEGKPEIISLESFEKESGYPYVADYYQLDTPYEFIDSGTKENLEEIDIFVKDRLTDEGKEPTLKNYSKLLRGIEKKLGIDDSTMRNLAIIKVANLARNFNLVLDAFSKTVRKKVLDRLLKMAVAGYSDFDQTEFVLEKLGGIV